MSAVVVYCHPNPESLSAALRDACVRGLQHSGHQVNVIDLAADHFHPVMSRDEWGNYHNATTFYPADVQTYIELVQQAEILIFVYPTWWSGVPAQLKGWIERVMVVGVAFNLDEGAFGKGLLTNVKHLRVVTTFGSPRWYVKLVNDNGRRLIARALRLSTSFRTKYRQLSLYSLDTQTEKDKQRFIEKVERAMRNL